MRTKGASGTVYTGPSMIGMITGTAREAGKGSVIIGTSGGVGYIVAVSAATKNTVLAGKPCSLFTYTAVRKDTMELYGFLDQEEYSAFLLLITVSGIGPKKAMDTLETAPPGMLLEAIRKEDTETLVSFGMGKKQAQRIILDLQKKIETEGTEIEGHGDLVATLVTLGYDKKEIARAFRESPPNGETIKDQVQEMLRTMRKGL